MDLGPGEVALVVTEVKAGPDQKVDSEVEEEDFPVEEDSREGSLIKALLQRDPVYPAKLKIKTRTDVIIAIRGNTLQLTVLRETRLSPQSLLKKRSLRIILTEEPQLATATALPQAYKEALSTLQQSLKNPDPLHGLNM